MAVTVYGRSGANISIILSGHKTESYLSARIHFYYNDDDMTFKIQTHFFGSSRSLITIGV